MAKKVTFYGIMAAVCIVLGYVETLLSFDFIAPGIKIGLSNSVALLLIAKKDVKGAFLVNIVRILLSALLFSAPSTLIYSLSGGIISIVVMSLVSKIDKLSIVGFSVLGAVSHNITQFTVALLLLGNGVWYYLPLLLIAAVISGTATGFIAGILIKKKIIYSSFKE